MAETVHNDERLANLQAGACAVVISLRGNERRSQRLAELGMTPGVQVDVVRAAPGQPMLLRVRRTLLALDRGSAADVLVRPVGPRASPQHQQRGSLRRGGRGLGTKRRGRDGEE